MTARRSILRNTWTAVRRIRNELMNMGQAQMDNGNYDTAITYFQNALELESVPNKQQITKAMIIAYEYSGDFATAKSKMEDT